MQITFQMNGETLTKRNESVNEVIDAVRPAQVHTDVFLTIKKGKHLIERHLSRIQAVRMFSDETHREVFINNLMLDQYV